MPFTWNSFSMPAGHAISRPLGIKDHDTALNESAAPRTVFQSFDLAHAGSKFGPTQNVMPTSNANAAGGHHPTHLTGVDAASIMGNAMAMKSGVMSHMDMQLAGMFRDQTADSAAGLSAGSLGSKQFQSAMSTDAAGNRWVTIDVTVKDTNGNHHVDASESANVLAQLQSLGMTNGSSYAGVVSGRIAVNKVGDLGNLLQDHDLGFARVSAVQTSFGAVDGQQDIAQHGIQARNDNGVNGSGVKVGVLSDSFDTNTGQGSGSMAADLATRDLPAHTTILEDVPNGSDEGRAMAQLIHDLAPGSDIDFATAFTGQAGFANNIQALADAGDRVIVDDVIYFFELAYQEGPIAQSVTHVAHDGVSYFSSAGNNSNEGLEQAWVDGGDYLGTWTLMQFAAGQDYLPITLSSSEVVILQWDEPGAMAGGAGSASDVDLFLTNQDGSVIYAYSLDFNQGADPIEALGISGGTGGTYYLRVGLFAGPAPTEIKVMALGNGAPVDLATTADNFNNGTIYGHASAQGATSVGAVRYDATPDWGLASPDSELFTSSGPTRIWFDNDGNRLAAPDDRGIDLSAVDGANNTFFGGDYEGDGLPNFFGTSAAAPDAAAVAALMIQARSGLTVQDIQNLMAAACVDMDANNGGSVGAVDNSGFDNGPDRETGAGLIQADLAVTFARTLHIENSDAVVINGTHLRDVIVGNGNINIINGGDGNDVIRGGIRGDTLTGGDGLDRFVYADRFDSHQIRHDTITDLNDLEVIDLHAIDADDLAAGNQDFHIAASFTGTAGDLVVKFHAHGGQAGNTTIKGYTNDDQKVDLYIVLAGDHTGYANFDF